MMCRKKKSDFVRKQQKADQRIVHLRIEDKKIYTEKTLL